MRSIIIGGGVGGCALAAALRGLPAGRSSVEVFERRSVGSPAGMGFILMPNGLDALERIAPATDWRSLGVGIDRVVLRLAGGRVLSDHSIEPGVCVGRERFLKALRNEIGDAVLHASCGVASIERAEGGSVRAILLEDGAEVEGDVFFGCDGARSPTRQLLFPEARLGEVVVKEIVSVAYAPALAAALGGQFHKFHDEEGGFAIGMLAEDAQRVVWFAQFDARRWPTVAADPASMADFIAERVGGWADEVRMAFTCTDFRASHLWPTRDLAPLAQIAVSNIALVGDAAHACLPFTSQGANGALVDAALLGSLLADADDPAAVAQALSAYSAARRPHHRRMFLEGRRLREAFLAPIAARAPVVPLIA